MSRLALCSFLLVASFAVVGAAPCSAQPASPDPREVDTTESVAAEEAALNARTPAPMLSHPVHDIAGVSGDLAALVGERSGLLVGASLALGLRFYGVEVFGLMRAYGGTLIGGASEGHGVGIMWSAAMFGFAAGPFHLAAGPSLDLAWGCSDANASSGCYSGGPLAGMDGRVSIQLEHLTITLDVHPTFYRTSTVTAMILGVGWALD